MASQTELLKIRAAQYRGSGILHFFGGIIFNSIGGLYILDVISKMIIFKGMVDDIGMPFAVFYGFVGLLLLSLGIFTLTQAALKFHEAGKLTKIIKN